MSGALQYLLNQHRREIARMVHDRVPVREIIEALPFPVAPPSISVFVKSELGMAPRAQRGRKDTLEIRTQRIKRRAEMIRLRKDGGSYEVIGQQFGVTHERVRQILHKYASELCGWTYFHAKKLEKNPWPTSICGYCGKVHVRRQRSRPHRYCSKKCRSLGMRGQVRSGPSKERRIEILAIANNMRREKCTWNEVAEVVGYKDRIRLTCDVRRWSDWYGIDVTDTYGFHGQHRGLNRKKAA